MTSGLVSTVKSLPVKHKLENIKQPSIKWVEEQTTIKKKNKLALAWSMASQIGLGLKAKIRFGSRMLMHQEFLSQLNSREPQTDAYRIREDTLWTAIVQNGSCIHAQLCEADT